VAKGAGGYHGRMEKAYECYSHERTYGDKR